MNRDFWVTRCREPARGRRYRFVVPATAVLPKAPLDSSTSSVGTRQSVTATDRQPIDQQLRELVAKAAMVSSDALDRATDLLYTAERIQRETATVREELEQFLDQFSLESGLASGSLSKATFAGGLIDLDAMRSDVAKMALDASKAEMVAKSLQALVTILDTTNQHFTDPAALSKTLDATADHFQAAINDAREDERNKLAREIHDGPAQVLANAIYHVQYVEQVAKRAPETVPEELERLRELLKEGVTEIRRFMFDLRPATLQHYGLGPTIQRYVEDYGKFFGRRSTAIIGADLPLLTPDQDLCVFRIVQQSLQNAHQHAGNDAEVDVTMEFVGGCLVVTIHDNGNGFDPALVSPKLTSGAGLMGMRDRAALANAQLIIESQLGKGTTVTLILPIDNQPPEAGSLALV